jgi:hypothetical protein
MHWESGKQKSPLAEPSGRGQALIAIPIRYAMPPRAPTMSTSAAGVRNGFMEMEKS